LEWVAVQDVLSLPLWEGDKLFLPLVFDRSGRTFHGVMPYQNGRPVSWAYSTL
jgi:8-oxo-dGTP diphosphatase